MGDLTIRQGGVQFTRLGPPKFSKQDKWAHAPEPVGLWAFPHPFWDPYLTDHRYDLVLPKHLRLGDEWTNSEREAWIKKHGRKAMPRRTFFYRGWLYSHITNRGEVMPYVGDGSDWEWVHTHDLPKLIRKAGGRRIVEFVDGKKKVSRSTVDHLEMFIPRGAGKIFG